MNEEKQSTFLVTSRKNRSFGTAFCISKNEQGSFLVSCSHVIEECGIDSLMVNNKEAKLLHIGSKDGIDLAVLFVESLNAQTLKLCNSTIKKDTLIQLNGFKPHKKESYKLEKLEGCIKKTSKIYHQEKTIETYELSLLNEDSIEKGYSGSAILLEGTKFVIAVASDRHQSGKNAYAIPIVNLKFIWGDMLQMDSCTAEKKYQNWLNTLLSRVKKFKKLFIFILGILSLLLLASFVLNNDEESSSIYAVDNLTPKNDIVTKKLEKSYLKEIKEFKRKHSNYPTLYKKESLINMMHQLAGFYYSIKRFDDVEKQYIEVLKIAPKNLGTYENLFELNVIRNKSFKHEYEVLYKRLCYIHGRSKIRYDMLMVLQNIIRKKPSGLKDWKIQYQGKELGTWSFNELDMWVESLKNGRKKEKIKEAISVFRVW